MKAVSKPQPARSAARRQSGTSSRPDLQQFLPDLFEQAPACIAVLHGREGTVLLCNATCRSLWGGEGVLGKPMREAWAAFGDHECFNQIEQAFDTGIPVYSSAQPGHVDRTGTGKLEEAFFDFVYAPYRNAQGEVTGVLLHGSEVTDKVQALQAARKSIIDLEQAHMRLRESEQRFRDMADAAPVLIWMSGTDKQCTYFNKAWLKYTGRTLQDELGDGWTQHVHPDDMKRCLRTYVDAFDARVSFSMEYRLLKHDGNYHWIIDNGAPRLAANGEFLGYIGSCTDIDEIKRGHELERMNTLLKKQRAQLVALNNAKDEFISIASHQLRTPASAVKQYIGLLLEGYVGDLSDMQLKMVQAAYESNQRQLSIVEDLLKVAQVDAGRITLVKRTCDVVQLLEDVIQEQRPKFDAKQQKLTYRHPDSSIIASVDQRLLRMVLENLIDNASKYSPEGKSIEVKNEAKATTLVLQVKDHGVGVSTKDQKRLFQKFSRLSNALSSLVSGSGLGLYWAKKIVDLHGGSITVRSRENSGSTFIIKMPLR